MERPPGRPLPPRVADAERARARFGARFDALTAALERSDPLADAAIDALRGRARADALISRALAGERSPEIPAEVRALCDAAQAIPPWVEWRRIARASRLFGRAGVLGGFVLAFRSLVGGYLSPIGNKPLVFSGRLREQAPRRLAETSRFVTAVTAPEGLRPGGEGAAITLRVRLMHAQVRRLLRQSPRWDHAAWGMPINQHDMLATIYLFSTVFTGGLRILGMDVSEAEGDDYFHLWRYVGVMIGVEPELLPWSEADAAADVELIHTINGTPDDDSRALAAALFDAAEASATTELERRLRGPRMDLMTAICRRLIGDEFADALGLGRGLAGHVLPFASTLVAGAERLRRRSGRFAALAERASAAYWEATVETGLRGVPATFSLPRGLATGSRPRGSSGPGPGK